MTETLIEIASEFGAHSPDVVLHARTDVPPRQAMEELRRQFPASFKAPFDARTASRAEIDAKMDEIRRAERQRVDDHATAQILARYAAEHARKK